nr:sensor domain-containing diguanylate cyclase [Vibrio sinus]
MHDELEAKYESVAITERKLRKSQNLLKHAQQIAQLGSWEWDLRSDHIVGSSEVFTIFELEEHGTTLKHREIIALVDPQERYIAENNWKTIPLPGRHIQWTNKLRLKNGTTKYVVHRAEALYVDTTPSKVVGIVQDITVQKQNELNIWHQANYDSLTNLVNRNLFYDRIEQSLAHAGRNHNKIGLLFIDLDDFKLINDTYGHNVGDSVLKEVALRLTKSVRKADTVARLGGDEFTLLVDDITAPEQVTSVAEKILDSFTNEVTIKNIHIQVSASIGIAIYPDNGRDVETLFKLADDAMYRAKKLGKKMVCTNPTNRL